MCLTPTMALALAAPVRPLFCPGSDQEEALLEEQREPKSQNLGLVEKQVWACCSLRESKLTRTISKRRLGFTNRAQSQRTWPWTPASKRKNAWNIFTTFPKYKL